MKPRTEKARGVDGPGPQIRVSVGTGRRSGGITRKLESGRRMCAHICWKVHTCSVYHPGVTVVRSIWHMKSWFFGRNSANSDQVTYVHMSELGRFLHMCTPGHAPRCYILHLGKKIWVDRRPEHLAHEIMVFRTKLRKLRSNDV